MNPMQKKNQEKIPSTFMNVGIIMIMAGIGIFFTVVWGPNIKYTYTYYHLTRFVEAYQRYIDFDLFLTTILMMLSMVFMLFAPKKVPFAVNNKTIGLSLAGIIIVGLFGIFLFIENLSGKGIWESLEKDELVVSSNVPSSQDAEYYLYFDKFGPRRLRAGKSAPIKLIFKILDHEALGAYPIALKPDNDYAVDIQIRTTAFDIAKNPNQQATPIKLNEPLYWEWIVSPKEGFDGDQAVSFDAIIYDMNEGETPVAIQESPYASITLGIVNPFGLPGWFAVKETGLGATFTGIICIVIGAFAGRWTGKKTEEQKKAPRDNESERWRPREE